MDEPKCILVADNDKSIRDSISKVLRKESYEVLLAEDGAVALEILRRQPVHLLLADLRMPGLDGVQLLKATKAMKPETEAILMTAHATVETAVAAMKEGAYDYILKPLKRQEILVAVSHALERQILRTENRHLKEQLEAMQGSSKIIGKSAAMHQVLEMAQQVAQSAATVLIQGETGTGKEIIAQAIHYAGPRKDKPLIKVNCAAIPETLLESELFGYERGAFTGAMTRKPGRFELADGGTLFLDEISELSPQVQVKLLRVLQEGEFERLGATKTTQVDVRIIAATNTDLTLAVTEKCFRADLFYRLNVIQLSLPSLRERREDIPLLVQHFLQVYCEKNQTQLIGISNAAMECLMEYQWPGNVRELENVIEGAVVLAKGEIIGLEDLPRKIAHQDPGPARNLVIPIGTPLAEIERQVIEETLKQSRGDKELAAKLLNISSRTIYRKLDSKKLGSQKDG